MGVNKTSIGLQMKKTGNRMIRPADAAKKLGIGLSTLWAKARYQDEFPKPIKLGPSITAFFEDELDAYITAQANDSRGGR
jgi:prophage regulatory protein